MYRGKTVYSTTHKSAHRPHRRDVTHIYKLFFIEILSFSKVNRNERVFPHTNPSISNVTQQCWHLPMLIFWAWVTCGFHLSCEEAFKWKSFSKVCLSSIRHNTKPAEKTHKQNHFWKVKRIFRNSSDTLLAFLE